MSEFVYDRVVVLGIDGAGAFFRQAETPNIDRIFADGAVSYEVIAPMPTVSAQCWGAILLGVQPEVHKLTNEIISEQPYDPKSIYPSVFRVIRENDPGATLFSVCDWSPINFGIVEDGIDVVKSNVGGCDPAVTRRICKFVSENDPKFLFAQFDQADGAGHQYGYGTEKHLQQIAVEDGYVGQIFEAYKARGFLDTTLFIVTADHGGKDHSHGGDSEGEKKVMFAARGASVQKGVIGEMELRDTAAVVLHALGYKQPQTWTGRVPSGLFQGVEAGPRPE